MPIPRLLPLLHCGSRSAAVSRGTVGSSFSQQQQQLQSFQQPRGQFGIPQPSIGRNGQRRYKSDDESLGSTVDRGTRFENAAMHFLSTVFSGMHLVRTGGANDGGIDLLGWWEPQFEEEDNKDVSASSSSSPSSPMGRFRVVVQCKAEAKKLGPRHVREIKGVINNKLSSNHPGLAVLASSNGFSKQCLLQGLAWQFPLLFVHLLPPSRPSTSDSTSREETEEEEEEMTASCLSLVPNDALSSILTAHKMEIRHTTSLDSNGNMQTTPILYPTGYRSSLEGGS